jgi:ADP-ribosylglycohydrolase
VLFEYPPLPLLAHLVRDEIRQRSEEGCDTQDYLDIWAEIQDERVGMVALYDTLCKLKVADTFAFTEPSDLETIRAQRADGPRNLNWHPSEKALADKMLGAWLGRCCGCALGKPFEMEPFMKSGKNIRVYLEAARSYPLDYYAPNDLEAARKIGLEHGLRDKPSQRDTIAYMESDDDIRYTVMGLDILERCGGSFTTKDVARWWLDNLGTNKCWTAEEATYRNLVLIGSMHGGALNALTDEQMDWVRTYLNPYREWIGAQIRADGWAYGAAGNPERAAEFAWRDASLSHVKNGIYGEMFCAAMIAAAFALDDPAQIVATALAEIPAQSRLYADMKQTIAICDKYGNKAENFERALEEVWAAFGRYHPVHTPNNAAAVVTALLLGQHDFEKVITIAVMAGWDTDCNGATAGSICGAMLGAKKLPAKWTTPLNDTLLSEVPGFHPIAISECARRSAGVWKSLRAG